MKCTNCKKIIRITCSCGYCLDCIKIFHPNDKFKQIKQLFSKFIKNKIENEHRLMVKRAI